ncbi:DMT family transporter [Pseudomonas sp. R2.Fl]|nr:DMT family transporter [Pseudomonas sp. R2.Fl]
MSPSGGKPRLFDWLLFFLAPVFFSSNLIFGRGISGEIAPFTTALIRWAGSAAIMFPVVYLHRQPALAFIRRHWAVWLWLGVLGMGICGGFVYWALTLTTASNATLIYTTSSLFIILFQWLFQSKPVGRAQFAGMAIAFLGVAVIVFEGSWQKVLEFHFNTGDIGILIAAVAFALYSLTLRHPGAANLGPLPLFGVLAISGALVLVPPAAYEMANGGLMPDSLHDWLMLAGIILFASLAAFYCFQHAVHVFGPGLAGTTLYLMPPISIVMAVVFLGETFHAYHAAGIVLVMGGLLLATRSARG